MIKKLVNVPDFRLERLLFLYSFLKFFVWVYAMYMYEHIYVSVFVSIYECVM